MSGWVKALVFGFIGILGTLAVILALKGDLKAAAGSVIPAVLASPLLLEAWRPGKYALRKPANGVSDNLFNRLKQFRIDHPRIDGTLILGGFIALTLALVGSLFVSLMRKNFSW